jgi:hypothetical protein
VGNDKDTLCVNGGISYIYLTSISIRNREQTSHASLDLYSFACCNMQEVGKRCNHYPNGPKDIAVPYVMAVLNNLTIRGQYMYEREDARGLIKLAEAGLLKAWKERRTQC